MTKEFVPYEEALALKELGFNEECFAHWGNVQKLNFINYKNEYADQLGWIAAPLYQQAFRWFREKHELYPDFFVDDDKTFGFMISYFIPAGRTDKPIQRLYKTYEEAELACLKQLIKIVKEKNNG